VPKSKSVPQPRHSASLQRHFLWLLLSVAGMFAVGIALSLWFSLLSNRETQQHLIQFEAEQARNGLVRRLDYYRRLVDSLAQDPDTRRHDRGAAAVGPFASAAVAGYVGDGAGQFPGRRAGRP
jgi:hypothetical protein